MNWIMEKELSRISKQVLKVVLLSLQPLNGRAYLSVSGGQIFLDEEGFNKLKEDVMSFGEAYKASVEGINFKDIVGHG